MVICVTGRNVSIIYTLYIYNIYILKHIYWNIYIEILYIYICIHIHCIYYIYTRWNSSYYKSSMYWIVSKCGSATKLILRLAVISESHKMELLACRENVAKKRQFPYFGRYTGVWPAHLVEAFFSSLSAGNVWLEDERKLKRQVISAISWESVH